MQMDSTRRPFDRSFSKEPGLKKPRLIEDPAAPDRISNGRTGIFQRPAVSNSSVGVGSRAPRDRDSDSSDAVRVPYQPQPGQQLHQELVTQYKTALSELTFNSKPIITNLTIIAGESLQASKAIAATICANILEVPSEQKLPSLYLLDSIVKNIGRDYIKYFASRLPEVFCKAYRQVDPSIHSGMRHLFGTWKGVFPAQTLHLIEKELGFTTTPSGSSSATTTTSRPESQAQRPAHSIHVNPKYLEARQRLQTTRAKGAGSDTSDVLVNSHEDVETQERTVSISSGKSWADPYAKPIQHHHFRDQANEPVRDKSSSVAYSVSGLGTERVIERVKEPGYDRPWYVSGSDMTGIAQKKDGFGLKRGFESHAVHGSVNSDSAQQLKQKFASTNSNGMSGNWKNSEEEEYIWEEMNPRHTVRSSADALTKDHWAPDNYDRLDFGSRLQRSQNMHDIGSRDDDEASAEGGILSGTVKSISSYPEGYKSSQSKLGKTYSLSHLGPAPPIGASSLKFSTNATSGPNISMTQPRQALGAVSSLTKSAMHQRPPSPSISSHNSKNQLLNNFPERNQTSSNLPTDSRRPPGHKNTGSRDQMLEDSLPLPSRDVCSTPRVQTQNLRSSSVVPPVQKRKHAPSAQTRSLEVSEYDESSGRGHGLLPPQISGSESRSLMGNSSSDQSNPLPIDSPGKSITSSLFDAAGKSGIPKSTTISGSLTRPSSRETRPGSTISQNLSPTGPPPIGSEKTPSAVDSTSNPVSSLLSSLVAKGLISSSKSDPVLSASPKIPDEPLDRVSSVSVTSSKPPITDEPSSSEPAASAFDCLPESSPEKIKNLIGFEFKPDVVRNLHPDVISDLLSDVPHQCSICGLRLKLKERFDRHMEWHALRVPEDNNKISRSWYTNLVDWVAGIGPLEISGCSDDEMLEFSEPMVPADESQCACILCGELFEDFYCQERDEWMFKGAIYLTDPSTESRERIATTSNTAVLNPIVHANCLTEETVRDLGLVCDVKLETNP